MSLRGVKITLESLGLSEDDVKVLGLLPLVEVAWADGRVQLSERNAIYRYGRRKGWNTPSTEELLARWLRQTPDPEIFETARQALLTLSETDRGLGAGLERADLVSILKACLEVARAAGGMFGLSDPVSDAEERVLDGIAESFRIEDWRSMLEESPASLRIAKGPEGRVIVGSLLEFARGPLEFLRDAWREHGDIVRLQLGAETLHLVVHPDMAKRVLVDNARNYRPPKAMELLAEVTGEGMLQLEGERWRKHRRLATPAFHHQRLAAIAETMTSLVQVTIDELRDTSRRDTPIELYAEMAKMTLRIAGQALFATDLVGADAAVSRATPILLGRVDRRLRNPLVPPLVIPTPENRRFLEARQTLDDLVYDMIRRRRAGEAPERPDLLQMLLDARDEETGEGLGDEELRDELITFLGAGHETTANSFMWTLSYLSKCPAELRRVHAEVREVLDARTPGPADVPRLIATWQAIEEAMRLRPPAWIIGRRVKSEDRIAGFTIPAGTQVMLSPYLTHRHPDFWENPEGYDPTRFAPEPSKGRHPFAYFPFGGGPRKCIGAHFAMMELSLGLSMLVRALDFSLLPDFDPKPGPAFTLTAEGGCWVTVHPR